MIVIIILCWFFSFRLLFCVLFIFIIFKFIVFIFLLFLFLLFFISIKSVKNYIRCLFLVFIFCFRFCIIFILLILIIFFIFGLLVFNLFLNIFKVWIFYFFHHSDNRNCKVYDEIEENNALHSYWVSIIFGWQDSFCRHRSKSRNPHICGLK